jgi:hypothetical protein
VKPVQTATANGGTGFSPLLIAIIVVVIIAVLIPTTMFYRRRGSGETVVEEAPPAYKPGMPSATGTAGAYSGAATTAATATSRYPSSSYSQQLTRPTLTPRPSQPSRYDGMAATRMCPGCKRPVKDYYSICPYCHRKLK